MKRILAIILASLLLLSVCAGFAGCSSDEEEEEELKGAEIQMYLTTLPESLDPAGFYTEPDTIRLMGLLYEGLTTIDEGGEVQNALAADWEYDFNKKTGLLELIITLEDSRWSDGAVVKSEDFRFSWQRALRPENNNPYASLLYPILNAKAAKEGVCSIDDIGVVCQDNKTIMITFEKQYANEKDFSDGEVEDFVDYFMARLASPALVPLRQDVVDDDTHAWCHKDNASYVTNGPFKIKKWNSYELTLERNVNYRCVGDVEGNPQDEIVKPYKVISLFEKGNADKYAEDFKKGEINYLNLNSASDEVIKENKKNIKQENLYSTFCLLLDMRNEDNKLFQNEKVRQALSLAIDREDLAKDVYAEPATGFVPTGVDNTSAGTDFRKEGGNLISKDANLDKAKKLLKEAGVTPKNETIYIDVANLREDEVYMVEKIAAAWKKLGFKVDVKKVKQLYINAKNDGEYEFNQNHKRGNRSFASVLAINVQNVTPDAYSMLTYFSSEFGGGAFDLRSEDGAYPAHITGFADKKYDELVKKFVEATDEKARATAMHEAEKYLAKKLPAIPVVFGNAYYVTKDLSNFEVDGLGRLIFTELSLDTYDPDEERAKLEAEKEAANK